MKSLFRILVVVLVVGCDSVSPEKEANERNEVIALIEIPAGTSLKYEWDKEKGRMDIEMINGEPRSIDYLAYPANYGMIKNTLLAKEDGGDGDPLDVIVLGPALERGSEHNIRVVGVMRLLDRAERDDKLIAVVPETAFEDVESLKSLSDNYPGLLEILRIWFTQYKGPGKMEFQGIGDEIEAMQLLESSLVEEN